MLETYLNELRKRFDSIKYDVNTEALYITVILVKGDKTIRIPIDFSMLTDDNDMINEIEKAIAASEV